MDYISFVKGKKVYIWGAWEVGRILDNELSEKGVDVVAYVDGKNIETERFYNNRELLSAYNVLPKIIKDKDAIVLVACAEHDEIKETLAEYGLEEGHNMIYLGNEITVSSSSKYYEDFYGNIMTACSNVPCFTMGMKSSIKIGKNVRFGKNVSIIAWGYSEIVIEDNVQIGDNCKIEIRDKSKLHLESNVKIEADTLIKAIRCSDINIADNCSIARKNVFFVAERSQISINKNTMFNFESVIRICNNTSFICGEECTFSYGTKIRGENGHTIIDLDEKKAKEFKENVIISNHVWVGMGVSLLGGTVINRDSIVGADSVVSKEFPPNSLIAGIPAKVIKENVNWDMSPNITYEEWKQKRNQQ